MAFHYLCLNAQTPPGTEFLLGLGLKYCIDAPRPYQRLEKSLRRIQRLVRLYFVIKDQGEDSNTDDEYAEAESRAKYIPSLYCPFDWQPPPAPDDAEHAMSKFDEKLNVLIRALPCSRQFNLNRSQRHCLGNLAQRQDLIVFPRKKKPRPVNRQKATLHPTDPH
jgi:hypothetical protein